MDLLWFHTGFLPPSIAVLVRRSWLPMRSLHIAKGVGEEVGLSPASAGPRRRRRRSTEHAQIRPLLT